MKARKYLRLTIASIIAFVLLLVLSWVLPNPWDLAATALLFVSLFCGIMWFGRFLWNKGTHLLTDTSTSWYEAPSPFIKAEKKPYCIFMDTDAASEDIMHVLTKQKSIKAIQFRQWIDGMA